MIEAYLSERKKKIKKRQRYVVAAIVFLSAYLVFWAAFWTVFRSPFFRVQSIVVEGNDTVASADVAGLLQSAALRDHNFWRSLLGIRSMFVWPDELSPADLAFVPAIASATVSRDYFSRTITVKVAERQPFAIWCKMPELDARGNPAGDERCFWFDDEGIVFGRAFDTQGNAIISIHDYGGQNLGLMQKVLPDVFVGNMISVIKVVKASGVDVQEVAVRDLSLEEVSVSTFRGPALYFSLRFPADEDLQVLQNLMQKPGFGKWAYIDFRVENRAYYK